MKSFSGSKKTNPNKPNQSRSEFTPKGAEIPTGELLGILKPGTNFKRYLAKMGHHELPLKVDMVGVNDRFGQSALPLQLVQEFGLTAEHIAHGALALMGQHCSEKLPSASACSKQNEFE